MRTMHNLPSAYSKTSSGVILSEDGQKIIKAQLDNIKCNECMSSVSLSSTDSADSIVCSQNANHDTGWKINYSQQIPQVQKSS